MNRDAILEFQLAGVPVQEVDMPAGAVILSVQTKGEGICLNAAVDSGAPLVKRAIHMLGADAAYVGVVLDASARPFHVWDAGEIVTKI